MALRGVYAAYNEMYVFTNFDGKEDNNELALIVFMHRQGDTEDAAAAIDLLEDSRDAEGEVIAARENHKMQLDAIQTNRGVTGIKDSIAVQDAGELADDDYKESQQPSVKPVQKLNFISSSSSDYNEEDDSDDRVRDCPHHISRAGI